MFYYRLSKTEYCLKLCLLHHCYISHSQDIDTETLNPPWASKGDIQHNCRCLDKLVKKASSALSKKLDLVKTVVMENADILFMTSWWDRDADSVSSHCAGH